MTLEELAPAHARLLAPLARDPAISRTSSVPSPWQDSYVAERMAETLHGTARHWLLRDAGAPCGMASLKRLDLEPGIGELSYWIGTAFAGRGLARAAGHQVVALGFGALGLRRITAHSLLASNPASVAVLRKLGFVQDERADEPVTGRFAVEFPGDVWRFYRLDRDQAMTVPGSAAAGFASSSGP